MVTCPRAVCTFLDGDSKFKLHCCTKGKYMSGDVLLLVVQTSGKMASQCVNTVHCCLTLCFFPVLFQILLVVTLTSYFYCYYTPFRCTVIHTFANNILSKILDITIAYIIFHEHLRQSTLSLSSFFKLYNHKWVAFLQPICQHLYHVPPSCFNVTLVDCHCWLPLYHYIAVPG